MIPISAVRATFPLSPPPGPSYVQGQPGGNLSSGNQSEDALDYLLNGLHATTAGNADNPVEEEDLDDDADNDTDGGEGAGKQDDTEASSTEQVEDGAGERQQGKEGAIGTQESKAGGSPGGGVVSRRSQTTTITGTREMTTPRKITRMQRAGFRTDPTTGCTRFSSPTVLSGGEAAARILTSRPRGKRPTPRVAKGSARQSRDRLTPARTAGRRRAVRLQR